MRTHVQTAQIARLLLWQHTRHPDSARLPHTKVQSASSTRLHPLRTAHHGPETQTTPQRARIPTHDLKTRRTLDTDQNHKNLTPDDTAQRHSDLAPAGALDTKARQPVPRAQRGPGIYSSLAQPFTPQHSGKCTTNIINLSLQYMAATRGQEVGQGSSWGGGVCRDNKWENKCEKTQQPGFSLFVHASCHFRCRCHASARES